MLLTEMYIDKAGLRVYTYDKFCAPAWVPEEGSMIALRTDFSAKEGPVKPMNAVNNGPVGLPVRKTGTFETYRAAVKTDLRIFFDGETPYIQIKE